MTEDTIEAPKDAQMGDGLKGNSKKARKAIEQVLEEAVVRKVEQSTKGLLAGLASAEQLERLWNEVEGLAIASNRALPRDIHHPDIVQLVERLEKRQTLLVWITVAAFSTTVVTLLLLVLFCAVH